MIFLIIFLMIIVFISAIILENKLLENIKLKNKIFLLQGNTSMLRNKILRIQTEKENLERNLRVETNNFIESLSVQFKSNRILEILNKESDLIVFEKNCVIKFQVKNIKELKRNINKLKRKLYKRRKK